MKLKSSNLSWLQYFCLGFLSASFYVPIIFLLWVTRKVLVKECYVSVPSPAQAFLWVCFIIVYILNIPYLNLSNALGTSLVFLSLLLFLIVPKSQRERDLVVIAFATGLLLNYLPNVIKAILLSDNIFAIYGRMHILLEQDDLLTSHISFYLCFATLAFLYGAATVERPLRRYLLLIASLISFASVMILLSKLALVVAFFALFAAKNYWVLGLALFSIFTSMSGIIQLLSHFVARFEQLFEAEDGRLNLWGNALERIFSDFFWSRDILQEHGFSSFHNIILDGGRFGGLPFASFISAFFILEMTQQFFSRRKSIKNKLLIVFLIVILQVEVIFEANYKILFILPILSCLSWGSWDGSSKKLGLGLSNKGSEL